MLDKLFYKLACVGRSIQRVGPAGRDLSVLEDDVFIVSYPKSGNTWARFLLGNLLSSNEAVTFGNLERKVPDIYQNSERVLARISRPRFLKSHEYLDPRYPRLIYMVRDPRDVAISYFHYLVKMRVIDEDYSPEAYIAKFVRGDWDPFGSWGDHVGGWLGARAGKKSFLLLRYEDMLGDPGRELERVAAFLGLSVSGEQIAQAVESSSFNRMRTLELTQPGAWKAIKAGRADKPFVRSAKAGDWQTQLVRGSRELIEQAWGERMRSMGYAVSP